MSDAQSGDLPGTASNTQRRVRGQRRWHRIALWVCCGVASMITVSVLTSLDAGFWHYAWAVTALAFASMAGRSNQNLDDLNALLRAYEAGNSQDRAKLK